MFRHLASIIFGSSVLAASSPVVTSVPYFPDDRNTTIQAVALDPSGNIYVTGTTTGEIPLVNPLQPKLGGGNCSLVPSRTFSPCPNVFVAKFDPTGTRLLYSTYLGGSGSDFAGGLTVDKDGNAYITGTTRPAGPFTMQARGGNAFVKKLNPSGSALVYTRYIGGDTASNGIAVDASGNAYIAGYSIGADFPSLNPLRQQPSVKSLYVTSDGGRTWRPLNNGLSATSINSLAIDPARTLTLYAATSEGIYKTTDAGARWTRLLPAAAVGNRIVIDPQRPSTIYAIYTNAFDTRLARSTDSGTTWTTISDNFPPTSFPAPLTTTAAFAIDPVDSNVLWAIINPNRFSTVIKSTDSGDHWSVVYTFPPDIFQRATLVGSKLLIDPKNPSRLWACCIHDPAATGIGGVYRSDDGGKSWIQGAVGPLGGSAGILSPWLDPRDSNVLYGDWYYGLQRSTDVGMTWAEVPLPPGLADHGYQPEALALDSAGTLYLLNDSGYLLRSSDSGASWTKFNGPWSEQAKILAIDPRDASTIYVASGASGSAAGTPAQHAFAARLDNSGATQWATLLGGSVRDEARAIALDSAGNAYITGTTESDDFPTVNPFQAVRGRNTFPTTDAFVAKISADGSKLLYSSFLGGTGIDSGNAIAVDSGGNAYVAGSTAYGSFPGQEADPRTRAASFVTKVDATGGKIAYSRQLSGSSGYPVTDSATAIAVDAQGRAVVVGITGDPAFPLVNPIQPTIGLGSNFIARLTPAGNSFDFSTYVGDLHEDINAVAQDRNGSLWIGGINGLARIDFVVPAAPPGVPVVRTVYNGASWRPGDVVAPGEIVTLMGEELAPAVQAAETGSLPRTLQGVSVKLGGVPVPLFYVSPSQINIQVPVEFPLGPAPLSVERGTNVTAFRTVQVVPTAPGLFAIGADVRGAPAVVHANDFSLVTEQNPARPGEYVAAFCTGLGVTNPEVASGEPATKAAPILANTEAYFESGPLIPVTYVGLAPGWVGLYQINLRVPDTQSSGPTSLHIIVGTKPANQGLIWVR